MVLFTIFVSTSFALAQIEVTGTVTDDLGDPLPGAAVLVKGTSSGTVTDLDGNFTISVANQQATLVFPF
ncbi:TonB-dependent receptor [Cyclobacterium qasimii M12-11B]|uniref:TonB-dependent receptor n=1 Tax=Cyclobacterium qasimii M12-11B TaxID=641524 RepID=S7VHP5_9BACT|nr:TonB-dependent receptor [Cyclobacterium qasimii M12-11B]